ncbi:MAG: phosphodiester glycosidase family protein, partial [Paracoccaceae bacterium]
MKIAASLALAFGLTAAMATASRAGTCETRLFEDLPFVVCTAHVGEDLRLFLRNADGRPLGSFAAVNDVLASDGATLAFAMNAGMYHADRRPVGYYVEGGQELAPLQRKPGPGNFGLVPNGVFCITEQSFAVIETLAFDAARPDCRYATQSGPMLVLSGQLHPKFLADS